ncbi:hypothetical protein thalar_01724 [Litoreibacter arenae DSM 19593]|uniref:Uncharacterized protein n=1 Tax=Litoreibacter arenae DSM 19593 TaxID=1123360 RepID=S9RY39_9RHOB|nr:hypothetical protein thalar_01724 [Litoreibacter arenae DSM 19593]
MHGSSSQLVLAYLMRNDAPQLHESDARCRLRPRPRHG